MSLSNIKKFLNKHLPLILIIVVIVATLIVSITCSTETSLKIFITVFIITIIFRIIISIVSKSNQITINIKDKTNTLVKLYEIFDLENINTIVAINTKDETILKNAKKLFPGSKEQKQKDLYSIMLPKASIKNLKLFLKDNDPERIIIHNFKKYKDKTETLSMCLDEKLIIQYNKSSYTKEQIKEIKDKLTEK